MPNGIDRIIEELLNNAWRHEHGIATSQLQWPTRTLRLEQCLILPACHRGRPYPSPFVQGLVTTTRSSCKSVTKSIQNFQQGQWLEWNSSEGLYPQAAQSSLSRLYRPCLYRNRFGAAFPVFDQKRNGDRFGEHVMHSFHSFWLRLEGHGILRSRLAVWHLDRGGEFPRLPAAVAVVAIAAASGRETGMEALELPRAKAEGGFGASGGVEAV